jgi:two-component system OmpR family sensor kinase
MTRSIRQRLQWWYGAVYAVALLVFGGLVYWRADRDVHERAVLQAMSTAQYLDVSLRSVRPRLLQPSDAENGIVLTDSSADPFPPEFSLGPLPPEFQFRPRPPFSPSQGPREGSQDQPNDHPMFGDQRPMGPPEDRRPPGRGPAFSKSVNSVRPPRLESESDETGRPPIDRMEFVVWRANGSVLTQSSGPRVDEFASAAMPVLSTPAPQVTRSRGLLNVTMRGPHQSTILVMRQMEHDIQRLHYFGFQIAGLAVVTSVIGIAGGWWVSGRMVQPIQQISETASQISAANLNQRLDTKNLDEELVQLATVLNGTFERLEQSFRRLTQFTADASHELRTPLAVIQSQVELALSQPRTSESYQQTLNTCLKSSERMKSLVDGLLLLARTDTARLELRPEDIDLRNAVDDAVMQLESKASGAGAELSCRVPDEAIHITADPRFITQIPVNLINNAIQHTSAGGRISVEVTKADGFAVLTVTDSGCGIAPEHVPHIFERFYRVDTARSRRNGGSGLGLAICQSLVEAQGGSIQCVSELKKGSTFTVKWPVIERD